MKLHEIYSKCLERIQTKGWCKGFSFEDDEPRCFLGTLGEVCSDPALFNELDDSMKFAIKHHPEIGPWPHIWNDKPERTKEDVVKLFKDLIEETKSLETE